MTRPRYERPQDLANEQHVAGVMDNLGYGLEKLPMQYRMDFAIFKDGDCLGFAEVKARTFEMNKYPTVMISLSKVLAARYLTQHTGLPCYLIVKYIDVIVRLDFADPFVLRMGGRADRGDAQDRDVCAFYSTERFTVVSHL